MRSARELERAADDARRLDEEAGRAGGERDLQRGTVAVQQERQVAAVARLDDAEQALLAARRATARPAGALIGSEHDIRVDRPLDAAPAAAARTWPRYAGTPSRSANASGGPPAMGQG